MATRPSARRQPQAGRRPVGGPASVNPVMRTLSAAIAGMELPAVEKISEQQQDSPFQVLIATLLSARTQDATTLAASTRLFAVAPTAAAVARLSVTAIERLIYPVSFYRQKAIHVKAACEQLVTRFDGLVPDTLDALLTLPGVGRKTANLVLIIAFRSGDHICVDTHVHRIANRLDWVRTTTPEETEHALYAVAARRWWPHINLCLVTWGQQVCRPTAPRCGDCDIARHCPRRGVTREGRARGRDATAVSRGPVA